MVDINLKPLYYLYMIKTNTHKTRGNQMTNSELIAKIEELKKQIVSYNNLQNEGGEGYNPYSDELENLDISQLYS